ncbi:MAG: hypothetical protein JWN04_353 [Myxococcaceae bacterium]|nr:hypothetical protein [Myxococcaceae bacterium]
MRHPIKLEAARARMRALNMTQLSLAQSCAIDVRTLQRWFAGQPVESGSAERVAAALGVGTAEVFEGVSSVSATLVSASLRRVLRLLSARENAFAQGLRTVVGHYEALLHAVSFASHPSHGYVARFVVTSDRQHGFMVLRVRPASSDCTLLVLAQIGQRMSYTIGRLRARDERVELLETWQTHSMVAELSPSGHFDLWVWGGIDSREIIVTCEQPLELELLAVPSQSLFDLDAPEARHAVCFRPTPMHLRTAGLAMGFDRVIGTRSGRVDVAVEG